MEPETLLHIGGCADGERRKVTSHRMRVYSDKSRLELSESKTQIVSRIAFAEDLYRLERIRGAGCEFAVMVLDSMDADKMIESLISKYPAPKDDD